MDLLKLFIPIGLIFVLSSSALFSSQQDESVTSMPVTLSARIQSLRALSAKPAYLGYLTRIQEFASSNFLKRMGGLRSTISENVCSAVQKSSCLIRHHPYIAASALALSVGIGAVTLGRHFYGNTTDFDVKPGNNSGATNHVALLPMSRPTYQKPSERSEPMYEQPTSTAIRQKRSCQISIWQAAMQNDRVAIERYFKEGGDLDAYDKNGETPLILAIKFGLDSTIFSLLKAGADPDAINRVGYSPLFEAVSRNRKNIVRMLLDFGADVNLCLNTSSPLIYAVQKQDEPLVKMLLDAGAQANQRSSWGDLVLFEAIGCGNERIVEMLLKAGADYSTFNNSSATPLIFATKLGKKALVQVLIDAGADVNQSDRYGNTSLAEAVGYHRSIVPLLLESGANPGLCDKFSRSPLDIALLNKDSKLVQMLIRADPFAFYFLINNTWSGACLEYQQIMNDVLEIQKHEQVPPKSCYVTFNQHDHNGAIIEGIATALSCKTVVISSTLLFKEFIEKYPVVQDYFTKKEWSLLFDFSRSLGVIIPVPIDNTQEVHDRYGLINVLIIRSDLAVDAIRGLSIESLVSELIQNFKMIIDVQAQEHPTRFYLHGHGGHPGMDPAGQGIIAAMEIPCMHEFLKILMSIGAEFLYINSCYAGGSNLIQLQDSIRAFVNDSAQQQFSALSPAHVAIPVTPPIIAIQATTGMVTGGVHNLHAFFKKLDDHFRFLKERSEVLKDQERSNISIDGLFRYLAPAVTANNLVSVRDVGKTSCFRAVNLGNMKIITWQALQALRDERRIKLEQLQVRLKTLEQPINPAYVPQKRRQIMSVRQALEQLIADQEVAIDIDEHCKYIQLFPCNLLDCSLIINGIFMPQFVSKIAGNARHCMGNIKWNSKTLGFNECLSEFIKAFCIDFYKASEFDRYWFIKRAEFETNVGKDTLQDISIFVDTKNQACCIFKYNNTYYKVCTDSEPKLPIKITQQEYQSTRQRWFDDSHVPDKALQEATGMNETNTMIHEVLLRYYWPMVL